VPPRPRGFISAPHASCPTLCVPRAVSRWKSSPTSQLAFRPVFSTLSSDVCIPWDRTRAACRRRAACGRGFGANNCSVYNKGRGRDSLCRGAGWQQAGVKRSEDHRASHGAALGFPAAAPATLCHVPPAQSTLRLLCSSLLCERCEPAMLAGSVSFVRLPRSSGLRLFTAVDCMESPVLPVIFRPPA